MKLTISYFPRSNFLKIYKECYSVGLMFDQDDAKLDSKNRKTIYTNFVSITYCIQKLSKYFEGKNNPSIIGFGSVSGF